LEVAALMVTAAHLDPLSALGSVSAAPRAVLGLPPVDVVAGAPADLVAVRGDDVLAALGAADQERLVWRAGRLVARTRVARELACPAVPAPAAPAPAVPAPALEVELANRSPGPPVLWAGRSSDRTQ
jgi:cytosine deaminase